MLKSVFTDTSITTDNFRIQSFKNELNLHKLDINNKKELENIINLIKPNEVYHLAAQSQDGHSFDNEFYTFNINLNFTHLIFVKICIRNNFSEKFSFNQIIISWR